MTTYYYGPVFFVQPSIASDFLRTPWHVTGREVIKSGDWNVSSSFFSITGNEKKEGGLEGGLAFCQYGEQLSGPAWRHMGVITRRRFVPPISCLTSLHLLYSENPWRPAIYISPPSFPPASHILLSFYSFILDSPSHLLHAFCLIWNVHYFTV